VSSIRPFFDLWYPRLVAYLRAKLGDADHAEDIAQEAFVRLLDESPRDPAAWLFVVANRLVIDHARVARGRRRNLVLLGNEAHLSAAPSAERHLARREAIASLQRALRDLDARERELILLHHSGWRYREIAQHLGIAASSVGSLLTRAERRLAASLAKTTDDGHLASN
jgi:RNA polymerase sigma factor (sigma-70 family)